MPCQDYGSPVPNYEEDRLRREMSKLEKKLIQRNDKLARIACKAMDLLEELGKEDFLLIKDKEVRDWWTQHKIDDAKAMKKKRKKRKK